jgi:hypothetical protein
VSRNNTTDISEDPAAPFFMDDFEEGSIRFCQNIWCRPVFIPRHCIAPRKQYTEQ